MKKNDKRLLLYSVGFSIILGIFNMLDVIISSQIFFQGNPNMWLISHVFDRQTITESHMLVLAINSVGIVIMQNLMFGNYISKTVRIQNVYEYIRIKRIRAYIGKDLLKLMVFQTACVISYILTICIVFLVKFPEYINFGLLKVFVCLVISFAYLSYITTLLINIIAVLKSTIIGFLCTYLIQLFLWWTAVSGSLSRYQVYNLINPMKVMSIYYMNDLYRVGMELIIMASITLMCCILLIYIMRSKQIGLEKEV